MKLLRLLPCLLVFGSCSSRGPKPQVFRSSEQARNPYFAFFASRDKASQNELRSGPWPLHTATTAVMLRSHADATRPMSLYGFQPPVVLHGDFGPLQMAYEKGTPELTGFERSARGPWWVDVFRMEVGAAVLAHVQGLRLHETGACLRAYETALRTGQPAGTSLAVPSRRATSTDDGPRGWTQGSNKGIPEEVEDATKRELRDLRVQPATPSPVYFGRARDSSRFVELREIPEKPLEQLSTNEGEACARLKSATDAFGVSQPRCWEGGGRAYAQIAWGADRVTPEPADFPQEKALEDHLTWMCSRLALAHARQWPASEREALKLAFERNPVFRHRLPTLAREEAETVLKAHRMILQESDDE